MYQSAVKCRRHSGIAMLGWPRVTIILALIYKEQGKYEDAAAIYQRSLVIFEKAPGPDHLKVSRTLNNLAELFRTRGRTPRPSRYICARWESQREFWDRTTSRSPQA